MKILLLGKNGQVGWELQRSLAPLGEVVACDVDSPVPLKADFACPESLVALARAVRPDVIVNAAAHTAVDKAESEPELVRIINAAAPAVLALEAAALGAVLVHYSTDYVFDGTGCMPRGEQAPTNPLNTYGRSKLEGEQLIVSSGCKHLVLRTSWVYSARGDNFARTMLRLAAERAELRVIDDQIGAPTSADLLADVTAHALRAVLADPARGGLYHCAASGETSWHGYARFVIEWALARGHGLTLALEAVHPVATRDFATAAARPLNSRLDTRRLQQTFGLLLPHWQQGVERMLSEVLGH